MQIVWIFIWNGMDLAETTWSWAHNLVSAIMSSNIRIRLLWSQILWSQMSLLLTTCQSSFSHTCHCKQLYSNVIRVIIRIQCNHWPTSHSHTVIICFLLLTTCHSNFISNTVVIVHQLALSSSPCGAPPKSPWPFFLAPEWLANCSRMAGRYQHGHGQAQLIDTDHGINIEVSA